ncbi:MAG: FAD-dependent oxidoreductase [Candidatus Omnitrophota bacterium]
MQEVRAVFKEKLIRTPTVASFRFNLPQRIGFIPGQFLQVIFDSERRDNKDLNKYLSFSCSPDNPYIEVTKRLSQSDFCRRLDSLKAGEEVLIKAPLGSCIFKPEEQKIAFLIGGIGITPVISIVEYTTGNNLPNDICLFYSNRIEEEIAFKKELDAWAAANPNFKVFYTVSECQPKEKNCIFGRIDRNLILRYMPDYKERVILIFGPPKMVEAMQELCLESGCSKDKIKTENFIGY